MARFFPLAKKKKNRVDPARVSGTSESITKNSFLMMVRIGELGLESSLDQAGLWPCNHFTQAAICGTTADRVSRLPLPRTLCTGFILFSAFSLLADTASPKYNFTPQVYSENLKLTTFNLCPCQVGVYCYFYSRNYPQLNSILVSCVFSRITNRKKFHNQKKKKKIQIIYPIF